MAETSTSNGKRQLIPDENIIVVFDTSPLRSLAHLEPAEAPPSWVETFGKMTKEGYRFSISDVTFAELMIQAREGRMPRDGYMRMVDLIKIFLNEDFPMLPGGADLHAMIGLEEMPGQLDEIPVVSARGWEWLQNPFADDGHSGPSLDELVQGERNGWEEFLEKMVEKTLAGGLDVRGLNPGDTAGIVELLASLAERWDQGNNTDPPMPERSHLEIRYRLRQMVRSKQNREAYVPNKKRNRNDGVDVNQFRYLILPALIVAEDHLFFGSLEGIDSFQRNWFMRPDELASKWLGGERPQPSWPVEDED